MLVGMDLDVLRLDESALGGMRRYDPVTDLVFEEEAQAPPAISPKRPASRRESLWDSCPIRWLRSQRSFLPWPIRSVSWQSSRLQQRPGLPYLSRPRL